MAVEEIDRETARAVGDVLRKHRDSSGLTQQQVATRAGIDWKYYQSLENGKGNSSAGSVANPTLQVLRKLASAYELSVPDLVWEVFNDEDESSNDT